MYRSRLAIVVATVVAACVVVSSADAAFSGNVCGLLSAKQVASVPVTPLKCSPMQTIKGPASTAYYGNWGGAAQAPHMLISVVLYQSATFFSAAKSHLNVLPGPAKKVAGIGSAAYESSGGGLTVINFIVGKYIVDINMRTNQPLKSLAAFNALSMSVASKL